MADAASMATRRGNAPCCHPRFTCGYPVGAIQSAYQIRADRGPCWLRGLKATANPLGHTGQQPTWIPYQSSVPACGSLERQLLGPLLEGVYQGRQRPPLIER